MRSTVLDRPIRGLPQRGVSDLLVLWQHPGTREIVPIGRFAFDGEVYNFGYTRAAAEVDSFRPLLGFNSLTQSYSSRAMPAVFNQRIMSVDRPDFADYLATLGLPTDASPWEQIVESGGGRAGDTLQFLPMPHVSDGRARARFFANGVRHVPGHRAELENGEVIVTGEEQERAIRQLHTGSSLALSPELSNPVDPDATLLTCEGVPVGWVPRVLSSSVRELHQNGATTVRVHRVSDSPEPSHTRLVLELDVPAPPGFLFDRPGNWSLLADQ
ncbi:hypothetical protein M3G03_05295 [Aestuariimicrobium sp. p3-SID1156]|uniref:hypothetical protein n=1 Tax=Aestuariimicrobium sp. p3-SID1156 TaxID=2916038 RepID=UPI00223B09F3|nr:hypothetical protein [Aestuariimicrobium sp. p3-SID1156]MCT1458957.1 hypothetical protein [Aestuariimicrobium sp. p3-SID1156]